MYACRPFPQFVGNKSAGIVVEPSTCAAACVVVVAHGVGVVGVSWGLVPLSATSQSRHTSEFEWCVQWCAQFRHARCSLSLVSCDINILVGTVPYPVTIVCPHMSNLFDFLANL
jgi:hypothetical protein